MLAICSSSVQLVALVYLKTTTTTGSNAPIKQAEDNCQQTNTEKCVEINSKYFKRNALSRLRRPQEYHKFVLH